MSNRLINRNTFLNTDGWGECDFSDLALVLNGVIYKYQHIIDKSKYVNKQCTIAPIEEHPYCFIIDGNNEKINIGLTARNTRWAQYVYQFAHEYCHYLIDRDNKGELTGAYWFEETICELSSIFMLRKMQEQWRTAPPYKHWQAYNSSFGEYVDEIINRKSNELTGALSEFIKCNSEILHQPDYQRELYTTIAVNIMDLFIEFPKLWNFVTYIKEANKTEYTTFENYLYTLSDLMPEDLKPLFKKLQDLLT